MKRLINSIAYFVKFKILKQDTYGLAEIAGEIERILAKRNNQMIIDIRQGLFVDIQIVSFDGISEYYSSLNKNKHDFYIVINWDDSFESSKKRIVEFAPDMVKLFPIILNSEENGIYTYILAYNSQTLIEVLKKLYGYNDNTSVIVQEQN